MNLLLSDAASAGRTRAAGASSRMAAIKAGRLPAAVKEVVEGR